MTNQTSHAAETPAVSACSRACPATTLREASTSDWGDLRSLTATLENVVDGLLTCNARGEIQAINSAAARLFGYRREEIVGKNVSLLMQHQYRQQHDGFIANYLNSRQSDIIGVGREVIGIRKDGSQIPLYISVSHSSQGATHSFTAVLQDRTEIKRAQARVQSARDEAEAANRAKSEFLASVSHELRTPLHTILSYVRFGLSDCDEYDYPEVRESLEVIQHASATLLTLVNDLLDVEQLEVGAMTISFEQQDIGSLISSVADEFSSSCSEMQRFLVLDLPSHEVVCHLDGERFRQVIRNLLANAVKFSPVDGQIGLTIKADDQHVLISVTDQGPGIAPDDLELIFEKFFRCGRTAAISGTGLGLAISRQIVELHGGRLWAENLAGGGSAFHCEVPRKSPPLP